MIDKENGRIEGSLRFANPRFPRYPIPVLKSLQRVATRVCEQITVLLDEILLRLDHLRDATIDRYKNVLLLSCPSNVSVDEINLQCSAFSEYPSTWSYCCLPSACKPEASSRTCLQRRDSLRSPLPQQHPPGQSTINIDYHSNILH